MTPEDPPPEVVDGGDRLCVMLLLLELRVRITGLPAGTVVHLIATDPAAPLDLPAWCHLTGHDYLGPVPAASPPTYALRLAANARTTEPDRPWHRPSRTCHASEGNGANQPISEPP